MREIGRKKYRHSCVANLQEAGFTIDPSHSTGTSEILKAIPRAGGSVLKSACGSNAGRRQQRAIGKNDPKLSHFCCSPIFE
jgi:hypothetical protein